MKKFIVFVLFCVSFLIVACGGGGNKQNDADESGEQDLDIVDEDETVSEPDDEQTPESDEEVNGSDQDSDSTEPEPGPEPEPETKKTCSEIFTCYIACRSEDCLKSCLKKGAEGEAEKFSGMYDCWLEKCGNTVLDDDFVSCAEENCKEKTETCEVSLKPEDAVKRFPKPYGKVKVSVASSYIITTGDSEPPRDAYKGTDFAQGYIGSVTTEPDYDYSSTTFYYTRLIESEDGNFLKTVQYHSESDFSGFTAFLFLPENVGKGKVKIGLDDDSVGQLLFGRITDSGEIVCYDGFGAGELDVKAAKALSGSDGKLAVSGEIDILTPYNEPENFDKFMSKLGKPLCAPKYPKFAGRLMYESSVASLDDGELDETAAIIDAEKYFAFEGSGIVGEGDIYVDLKELVGLGYSIGPSSSSGAGSSLSYFFKGTAETPAHPEGEPAILLSVTGDEVLVGATILLSDIQKAYIKPLKYAPEVIVYKIISCSYDSCDVCILAGNKVENGVRVGEFQSSYYSKHDFDSTDTVASLSVAMSAELVDGEELLELYPEEQLCISME